jgi:tRNA U55 pseudouridine synthase TruB
MPERSITIKEFELLRFNFPEFEWKVKVSKGTYIRTLTEQIAGYFENVATTVELQRTKIGGLLLEDSVSVSTLSESTEMLPYESLLSSLPKISLENDQKVRFLNGIKIEIPHPDRLSSGTHRSRSGEKAKIVSVYSFENIFLGIGSLVNNNEPDKWILKPEKVLYDRN